MVVVLMETYFNKVNIQVTQRDDFIQIPERLRNHHHLFFALTQQIN